MDGLRLQVSALAGALSQDHDVRVIAYGPAGMEPQRVGAAELRLIAQPEPNSVTRLGRLAADELHRRPFGLAHLAAGMAGTLGDELAEFNPDVVHVASGKLAGLHRYLDGRPAVLAALDATHVNIEAAASSSSGIRRRYHRHQAALMRRFATNEYPHFDRVVVVTEQDRAELERITAGVPIDVITNGVDANRFKADPSVARVPGQLVFTGALNYPPNVSAAIFLASEVMPLVRRAHPNATLKLVGRAPAAAVRDLDELDGVDVVGEVPEMNPWLSGSWAYVCPMRSGTGIKNKLLEALANGLPCIATSVATQGMGLEPNRDILIGEDPSSLTEHIVAVLENEGLAGDLGEAGHRYVLAHHSWDAVGRTYASLYGALVRHGGGSPNIDHNDNHE